MISIVIPAYDEADGIAATIAGAKALRPPDIEPIEIIVVDDGSTDDTARAAADAGARVVRHPHNLGYGRALKTGIAAASHDTIVIVDADGTYPLSDIPRLVATFHRGFDMVVGARTGSGFEEGFFKTVLRRVLTFLVEFTTGRDVPDVNSGLRVFSRGDVLPYFNFLCDTFSFTTSLTLAYMMTGRFVHHEPIPYVKRVGRTKVRLIRDALRTMQYIVQAIVYYNPIKIFLILTLAALAITTIGVLIALSASRGLAALIGTVGLLTSVLLFGLGLTADLLKQIMHKP